MIYDTIIGIVMLLALAQARSQAKPGQIRPSQAKPKCLACCGLWPGPGLCKPKALGLGHSSNNIFNFNFLNKKSAMAACKHVTKEDGRLQHLRTLRNWHWVNNNSFSIE